MADNKSAGICQDIFRVNNLIGHSNIGTKIAEGIIEPTMIAMSEAIEPDNIINALTKKVNLTTPFLSYPMRHFFKVHLK